MIAQTPNYLRKICKEYERVENYEAAVLDNENVWIMHHRRGIDEGKSAKELDDEGNYKGVPPEDLIFITRSEHSRLHNKGKIRSEEHNKKLSESRKGENNPMHGKHHSEEAKKKMADSRKGKHSPMKGKHHSEDSKQKMSESHKGNQACLGLHWYTNGTITVRTKECPEGFVPGRLKK